MKSHLKKIKLVLVLTVILLISCSKDSNDENQTIIYGDSLSEDDNLLLESISVPTPELTEIVGLNRLSSQQEESQLQSIIRGMITEIQAISKLKTTERHIEEEGTSEIIKPEHYGVAYSYGQRNFAQRLPPNDGNALHKKYWVFGTDCSGIMIKILRSQGILIGDTNVENFESSLRTAIANNSALNNISLENKGYILPNEIKNGDFIRWFGVDPYDGKFKKHIGIIVKTSEQTFVFQSNGNQKPSDLSEQEKNYGLKRGVHPVSLSQAIENASQPKYQYWGRNYTILRMEENVSNFSATLNGTAWYASTVNQNTLGNEIYISGVSDYYILEFHVAPVVGIYTNQRSSISYPEASEPGNGYHWISNTITVTSFNDNILRGTINAVFQLDSGEMLNFSNGEFEILIQ